MVLSWPQLLSLRTRASARAAIALSLCAAALGADGQTRDVGSRATPDPAVEEATADAYGAAEDPSTTSASSTAEAYRPEIPTETHLTRLETQIEFIDLINERRLEEALPLAESMVTLTEAEFGSPSEELATALNNLAIVQRNLEHYDDSKASFVAAIDMFREVEGPFTESIINPLVSLGANYHATGDYPQALGLFQEARTANRRSYGLLNPEQVEIVYHIAATLASMRRYEEAHLQQEDALRLMERVHGTDTMEILPYIYRYAEWLVSAFQFEPARFQLVRAMDIIRLEQGPDSPELIKPLTEIGNSYRTQKLAEGRGISALNRALEIVELQPEPNALALARVLRDIGDWYTAFSRVGATGQDYLRAWQLLGEVEDGESIRAEWFAEPDYVLREYPSSRGLAEASDLGAVQGHVRVVFDVNEDGRPLNVTVLESDPPDFKDATMMRAIRRSRFRPQILDGVIVYSKGLIRNFTFYYVTN